MTPVEAVIDGAARHFGLPVDRVKDTQDRVAVVVNARLVAVYILKERLQHGFGFIARAVGYADKSNARGAWLHAGSLVSAGRMWFIDAVADVERLAGLDKQRDAASSAEDLCAELRDLQLEVYTKSRALRGLLGREVLKGGFYVKLAGLPYVVRDVFFLRDEGGAAAEEMMIRVEPDNSGPVEPGPLLDGRCSRAAGPMRMEELARVEV